MVEDGVHVTNYITCQKWELIFKEKLLKKNTDILPVREAGMEVIVRIKVQWFGVEKMLIK